MGCRKKAFLWDRCCWPWRWHVRRHQQAGSPSHPAPETGRAHAGNPVYPGWYADPEAAVLDGQYWIYPTSSATYDQQLSFDAFSSPDLVHWTKHPRVVDGAAVQWAKKAMWAPAIVARGGKYYFFFWANDIQSDEEVGSITTRGVKAHPA